MESKTSLLTGMENIEASLSLLTKVGCNNIAEIFSLVEGLPRREQEKIFRGHFYLSNADGMYYFSDRPADNIGRHNPVFIEYYNFDIPYGSVVILILDKDGPVVFSNCPEPYSTPGWHHPSEIPEYALMNLMQSECDEMFAKIQCLAEQQKFMEIEKIVSEVENHPNMHAKEDLRERLAKEITYLAREGDINEISRLMKMAKKIGVYGGATSEAKETLDVTKDHS